LPDPDPGDTQETDRPEAPTGASRRPRLLIGVGVVVVGAVVALLIALNDESGEPRPSAGGSDGANASAASENERAIAAPKPAARAAAPKTGVATVSGGGGATASGGGGATPTAAAAATSSGGATATGGGAASSGGAGASGGLVLAGHNVAGSGGRTGRAASPASPASGHPAVASADKPDGGASSPQSPDGGVRPPDRKPTPAETARRAKGDADDRERDADLVLVSRFTPTGGAMLEGRIVEADGGRPVVGVVVEARHAGKFMKGSSDAGGVFRMAGLIPGTRVVVWIGGKYDPYIAERIDVAVPAEGQKADTGLVRLLRGDEMGPRLDGWVGLFVTRRGGRVTVSAVTPWLPADRAGVMVGDVVVSINGRDTAGFGPRAATYLLRGPPSTSVSFVVEDHAAQRRKLTLDRVPR
jgi:hypothetical protein